MTIGLIKDLVGLLNQSSLNTLTFQRTDHKKVMKKHFNKNLIITEEEDEQYQSKKEFGIKNTGDYHDHYLKKDVVS